MKSQYSFKKEKGYLCLTLSGDYDRLEFLSYPKIIKDECEKQKIYKVLISALEMKGTDTSTMDRFFLGEELAKSVGGKIKVAATWPEVHIDRFMETVAVNRGVNFCVFADTESAIEWLLDN